MKRYLLVLALTVVALGATACTSRYPIQSYSSPNPYPGMRAANPFDAPNGWTVNRTASGAASVGYTQY